MSDYELDCNRRCRVSTNCAVCGKLIPAGSPNFTYNTRDRFSGKRHEDCSKPDGWNQKHFRIEPDNIWKREDVQFTTKAKFDGECFTCHKPTIQGITDITPCADGKHWRHSYCEDTTIADRQKDSNQQTTTYEVEPESTDNNMTQTTTVDMNGMNPITAMIWKEIEPLVAKVDKKSGDANAALTQINNLLEKLKAQQADFAEQLKVRPKDSIQIVERDGTIKCEIDSPHPMFKKLLFYAMCRKHVYLYGPAGSGKSTAAEQVATALGVDFRSISLNRYSTPSKVEGFMNAHGDIVSTDFRHCWENGGVFLIDEMDNASGNLLTTLNSALANGYFSFPDGMIKKHANFICIATGNTTCKGGDKQYNERQQLDAATIDRFIFINWQYDEVLELKIALSKNPNAEKWVKTVQAIRAKAAAVQCRHAITPRASIEGADLLAQASKGAFELTFDILLHDLIYKGLDADTINKIKVTL